MLENGDDGTMRLLDWLAKNLTPTMLKGSMMALDETGVRRCHVCPKVTLRGIFSGLCGQPDDA
jgi:hypothetical protein